MARPRQAYAPVHTMRSPSNSRGLRVSRRRGLASVLAGLVLLPAVGIAQSRLRDDPRFAPQERPASLEATALGLAPDLEPAGSGGTFALVHDGRVRTSVRVTRGRCYAAIGWSPTIDDLDLWVWDEHELVGQDVASDAWPAARWCARRTADVELEWVAFEGSGPVEWTLLTTPEDAFALGPRDELSNRLDAAMARTAPRFVPFAGQYRGFFRGPGVLRPAVRVVPGCCHAIVATGDAFVEDVDLRVVDARGRELTADRSPGRTPAVMHCVPPDADREIEVELTLIAGYGGVAFRTLVEPACKARLLPPPAADADD